jgi:hypothetical protein
MSEHVLDIPLQPREGHGHPAPSVQQEQLDPVPVNQGPAEADAKRKVVLQRRQRSPGPEKAVGGTNGDPSILTVGPQQGWEVELGVVADSRSPDAAVQPQGCKPSLEPSQLVDRKRALVGVISAGVEEHHHCGACR